MMESVLKAAGLSQKEAQVYEQILKNGKSAAISILNAVPLKRGDLYNVLRRLEEKRLIRHLPECKKLTYQAGDPEIVERAIRTEEQNIEDAKENISLLYSLYNLGIGKPGVRFAQGLEGIKEMFNDTLTAKTEILCYADIDGWIKYLEKYARWYGKERRERNIKERGIVPDTSAARKYLSDYDASVTQFKLVPYSRFQFSLEMDIYDNKVLYVTLREPFIAVLIENQAIADTQRSIFELSWAFH